MPYEGRLFPGGRCTGRVFCLFNSRDWIFVSLPCNLQQQAPENRTFTPKEGEVVFQPSIFSGAFACY